MNKSYRVMSMLFAGLLLVGFGSMTHAADLIIVDEGKANAVIIVAAGETNASIAAGEIQKYIEKMSGVKLDILDEAVPDTTGLPVKIAVGHTRIAKKSRVAIPSGFKEIVGDPNVFEEEGFVIKTKKNRIILAGNSDGPYQGTIYAGYEFLERLGCRWYFPGEWGEVVPKKKTITFPETDLVSKPDFAIRTGGLGGWIVCSKEERAIHKDWSRKVKHSNGNFYPLVGDGFLGYLLPPKEFMADEPMLYAMNKLQSREQPENFNNGVMLSLVNPRTFELAVENLKGAFAGTSKSRIMRIISPNGFGISPPDGSAYDYDPVAVKKNPNFDYPTYIHHPQTSTDFFTFAVKLANEFPDKWVATMAYAGREVPPQGVTLPKNLAVMYAPIATCVLHDGNDPSCWRRQETISIMQQWCKLTPHVYLYDYNPGFLLGAFVPERDVANFTENVKLYKKMKLKGFTPEGRKAFMQTWISYYMRGKLMWNANADVEALKKDFYTTFFGSNAGPLVQQWWDECEAALGATTMHCHEDWLVNHVYTVPFTAKLHTYVEQASKSAMTPKQKERFQAFAVIADHLEAFAAMNAAEENLDYAEAKKQALRMEDDIAKLIATYSFFMGPKKHPEFMNGWAKRFEEFHQMVNGSEGKLVAALPLDAKFTRDRFNEGVLAEWYLPEYDDSLWGAKNTYYTWDQQDTPEDAKGHDYDGYGWYRMVVDVPASAVKKPLKLHLGGIVNEGWVWINGQYVGHREHKIWWSGRARLEMDVDVSGKVKKGANVIVVRVWNNAEVGGLFRRGFIWAPTQ